MVKGGFQFCDEFQMIIYYDINEVLIMYLGNVEVIYE